jgi:ankyrin repeat protein
MGRILKACGASLLGTVLFVAIAGAAGDSPLTKAVKAGDVQAVRALVKSGADVNARSGDGSTPLLWAASSSAHEIARILIDAKATVDTPNDYGITPLLHASTIGDAAMADLLLKAGANPSRAHPEGETPLMAAARSGSVPIVRLLLARGADVNAAESFQNTTALMWAAAERHLDVVDVLLEAGADINRQGHITTLTARHNADHPTGGFTALMWAARNGDDALVRRLAAKGANLNLKNGDGASATMVAIYNDWFDVAKGLIELGSDANDGSLYVAVEMRDATVDQFAFDGSRRRPDHSNQTTALDLMRILLERGADPNKTFAGQFHSTSMPNTDRFDNTPFFRAAIASTGRSRTRARQSQRRPHRSDGDDDRWPRTGDDRRPGVHSRWPGAVSRAGKPQA